ncbi:MAG TPA: Calx-beta domain-containing protein [Verrucomicrobiae bacterium]
MAKLCFAVLIGMAAGICRSQTFESPLPISGVWGATTADNSSASTENGDPNVAGYPPNAPVWFQWTAPQSGVVTVDTIGTGSTYFGPDTVLGVYSGTSLKSLTQIAANDDLFPVNRSVGDNVGLGNTKGTVLTESANVDFAQYEGNFFSGLWMPGVEPVIGFVSPYYGPSALRFNAVANQTYYFVADTKSSKGLISLNWAYQPSGVFRFASEDIDQFTALPLYQTSETESSSTLGAFIDSDSAINTYYTYNAPGVLVTVTRVGGATGRASVQYQTVDGTSLSYVPPNDMPGIAGVDYVGMAGTLIFDDNEMSKTILIPIENNGLMPYDQSNRVFGVELSNPQPDGNESSTVSLPRIDPAFSTAIVKILNVNADPYGQDMIPMVSTNILDPSDTPPTNFMYVTNYVPAVYPTNTIFNFVKADFRLPQDVNNTAVSEWPTVTIYVERFGTNTAAATISYRVNNYLGNDQDSSEEWNNHYPLQPGSDYAVPTPPTGGTPLRATNSEFTLTKGTLPFAAGNSIAATWQSFTFTVTNYGTPKFNKDFKIQLYEDVTVNGRTVARLPGMVSEATVTILANDQNPPAGSVDELYNADFAEDLALYPSQRPVTTPTAQNANPGIDLFGEVNGIAMLPNNESLIGGDFESYDDTPEGCLALVTTNGLLDSSFSAGFQSGGANGPVDAVAVSGTGNQFVVGGSFTAMSGKTAKYVARLNANGTVDTSFNSGGAGANNTVRAVLVETNGETLIGGDFTNFNGHAAYYVALLNTNGALDTNFSATAINGSVYSLAIAPTLLWITNVSQTVSGLENDDAINLGSFNSGTLTVNYNMLAGPDDLRVYYGTTNVNGNTGVLIYDSTATTGTNTVNIPFGPTQALNGSLLTANALTIVVNQAGSGGGGANDTWKYRGTVNILQTSSGILVGGDFSVSGQSYADVARLNANGSLDTSFNPGTGPNGTVHSLGWQLNNQIVAGGEFTAVNGTGYNYLARFNGDGSLDITNFFIGSGADNNVYAVDANWDGNIYIGGSFSMINGTHRLGYARLYSDGVVDTTFMDTAYNQFAGLKRVYSFDAPAVFATAVQYDNNDDSNYGLLIGGSFYQVGGGQADTNVCDTLDEELTAEYYDEGYYSEPVANSFDDNNLWVEPKTRDGVRNRSNFARLIGGATPGPGNIGLNQASYAVDKSLSTYNVSLVRTNGSLGPGFANFSVQNGTALSGSDFTYDSAPPLFWVAYWYLSNPTRQHSDGLFGLSGELQDPLGLYLGSSDQLINKLSNVNITVIRNKNNPGNLNAQFTLANPSESDAFYLGGEEIPLGTALGISSAPFTLIDDISSPSVVGYSTNVYIATNLSVTLPVLRANNIGTVVTVHSVTGGGTAIPGTDYISTNQAVNFNQNVVSNHATITIKGDAYISNVEKTIGVSLAQASGGTISQYPSTTVRIINPLFNGYVSLAANSFSANLSAGVLNFTVNRLTGSAGTLTVLYTTTNNTAFSGTNYVGETNTLTWVDGDVSPKVVSVPLINAGVVGGNLLFGVALSNPTLNRTNDPAIMGIISNAVLVIANDNSYGALQFFPTNYVVNENGGYATLTVVRTGGSAGNVSVDYKTIDGTATSLGGTPNYISTNGVLTFAPNQTAASFQVPVLNDGIVDPANFYFMANLYSPTNAIVASSSIAWVHMLDVQSYGEPPGSPDVYFSTPGFNGSVFSLALQTNAQILVAGDFTAVGTTPEGYVARLNADGSLDGSFLGGSVGSGRDGAFGPVNSVICQTDNRIMVGGSFSTFDDVNRNNIARLMTDGSLDTSFNPGDGADNTVNALAETFINGLRRVYVAGAFNNISGVSSPGIARLEADNLDGLSQGTVDSSFAVGNGVDGPVYTIAVYPTNSVYAGKLLIGGSFQHYNGFGITNLARLNVDGSLDASFNNNLGIGPNGIVRSLAIQADGNILVGGAFVNFNGTSASNIIRLQYNGTIDTNFVGNADGSIEGISVQADNRIMVVGQFSETDGFIRSHVSRLLPTGAVDPTINFGYGANGDVDALVIQPTNNAIIIGGTFSLYDNQAAENIAEIYGSSETGSGEFSFTTANYYVHETGSFAVVTLERTGGTSGTNSDGSGNDLVDFYTTNLPAINAATNGINYVGTNEIVAFPPGAVFESVTIPVYDDGVVEMTNLLVGLDLSGAPLGNQPIATLNIINDDSGISFTNPPQYFVDKNDVSGMANIDVIRQGGTNGTVSVDFYTSTNGTAVAGLDYTPTNEVVTFPPGVSDVQVQVAITNNNIYEGNRTIDLVLTNAIGTGLLSPTNGTLTIIETTPAPGQVSFSTNAYYANKTDASAFFTVIRTNGTKGDVTLGVEVLPATAVPGLNYINPSTNPISVHFKDGDATPQTFSVSLQPNNLVQGTVYFTVSLTNLSGAFGPAYGAPTNATVSIVNNINTGVNFLQGTNVYSESNSPAVILVERLGNVSNSFTVNYATTNGTAIAGNNYLATSGTLTFATNTLVQGIPVTLINQQMTTNLAFGINLSSPSGAQLLAPSNTLVVIQGSQAGLYFTNSFANVFKNAGVIQIPVICNNTNLEPVVVSTNVTPLMVSYFTADGTAIASQDYSAASGTLTFTNGIGTNYINITVLNNSLITGTRTFTISLTNATAPGKIIYPGTQAINIIDSNSGLSFSQPAYSAVRNNGAVTINVVRTDNTNVVSTVLFSTANGTAMTNVDYFPTNGVLTFTNGVTSESFSVGLISATTVQPDKTVLLQLSSPTNGLLAPPSAATLTIHDNSGSLVVPAGSTFAAGGNPNNDGLIDPGETVTILFAFRAEGGNNITNLYATLLVTNGVTAPTTPAPNGTPTQVYSNLFVDGPSESQPYTFTASGSYTNGQQLIARFALMEKYGGVTNNLGTNLFTYTLGTWNMSFTNTNAIIINPAPANGSQPGMASNYPAVISISNIIGTVFKTTVTLTNLTHSSEYNVNALLVAPNAADTLFLSHAGTPAIGVNGVTLTFSDTATNTLPYFNNQSFTNGVYKPAANGATPVFP